ncbi:MAG: putative porin [Desulfobacterales bacterium]
MRVRYEYKEKDVSNEDPTDRMRQRFRLGMKFATTENWTIAAGLATGGSDSTSTNDTWSDGAFLKPAISGWITRIQEHNLNNFTFIAGQQKNPFQTTWALWDGDVRLAGFTGMMDLKPIFITAGWYDVYYADKDMAQMEAIQGEPGHGHSSPGILQFP